MASSRIVDLFDKRVIPWHLFLLANLKLFAHHSGTVVKVALFWKIRFRISIDIFRYLDYSFPGFERPWYGTGILLGLEALIRVVYWQCLEKGLTLWASLVRQGKGEIVQGTGLGGG